MARISIYIGRHLCTAPRPCKEADALAADGHEVTVCGLWSDPRLVARDVALLAGRPWRFSPYACCQSGTLLGRWRWLRVRARSRLAREVFLRTGRATANAFGYGTTLLARHAADGRSDLALFHSEGGLWAAERLHRAGRRVGVDFEDWFSRDLPQGQRGGRPIEELARLEAAALRFGPYALATSRSMAKAIAEAYSGPEPTVIYNTFPIAGVPAARATVDPQRVSLHWFSLVLGPDRGLETLFCALPQVPGNWELHLRADDPGGFGAGLLNGLPERLRGRVRFHPTVPNAELPARIAEHDIGLALDVSGIPSRNLTVTNKMFQYLQAGLAVVASDTAGNREIFGQAPGVGTLFCSGDAQSLARELCQLCSDPARMEKAKRAARRAGETIFAHERQAPLYGALAARALQET